MESASVRKRARTDGLEDSDDCVEPANGAEVTSDLSQLSPVLFLKMLVPSMTAGGLIGKGGETIVQLQKDYDVKIRMSKANEFYPGTTDRVCVLSGSRQSLLDVFASILDKLKYKEQYNSERKDEKLTTKLLLPTVAAGIIIGKGGETIKRINQDTGANIKLSDKRETFTERIVSIVGDQDSTTNAVRMILDVYDYEEQRRSRITDHLSINYDSFGQPVGRRPASGSHPGSDRSRGGPPGAYPPPPSHGYRSGGGGPAAALLGAPPRYGAAAAASYEFPAAADFLRLHSSEREHSVMARPAAPATRTTAGGGTMDHSIHVVRSTLLDQGYSAEEITEITAALLVLSRYNLIYDITSLGYAFSAPLSQILATEDQPSSSRHAAAVGGAGSVQPSSMGVGRPSMEYGHESAAGAAIPRHLLN